MSLTFFRTLLPASATGDSTCDRESEKLPSGPDFARFGDASPAAGGASAAGRFRLAAEPAPCWLGDVRRSGTEGAGGLLCERGRAVPCPTVWTASGGRVSFWAEDEGP